MIHSASALGKPSFHTTEGTDGSGEAFPLGRRGEGVAVRIVRPGDAHAVIVDPESVIDRALVPRFELPVDDGEVLACDLTLLELLRESSCDLFCAGDEEAAGSGFVEPVYGMDVRSAVRCTQV